MATPTPPGGERTNHSSLTFHKLPLNPSKRGGEVLKSEINPAIYFRLKRQNGGEINRFIPNASYFNLIGLISLQTKIRNLTFENGGF